MNQNVDWSLWEKLVQSYNVPKAAAAPPAKQLASVLIAMERGPLELWLGDGYAHVLKQLQCRLYNHQIPCASNEASNNEVGEQAQTEVCTFSDNMYEVVHHGNTYGFGTWLVTREFLVTFA